MYEELYDEIFDILDDTMEISHQITEYLIKITQADIAGVKIKEKSSGRGRKKQKNIEMSDVENNTIIKVLFERLQQKYRMIEEKVKTINQLEATMETEKYSAIATKRLNSTGDINSMDVVQELIDYLENSYLSMRFIPKKSEDGEIQVESIYDEAQFEDLHYAEYDMQSESLLDIRSRLALNEQGPKLNFLGKAEVLQDMAKKKFFKQIAVRHVESHIEQFKKAQNIIDDSEYQRILTELYEEKYIQIYLYLQNKYCGIMQENDKGRIANIKNLIDDNAQSLVFGVSETEIEANVALRTESYIVDLREDIMEIEGTKEEGKTMDELDKEANENVQENNKEVVDDKAEVEEEK